MFCVLRDICSGGSEPSPSFLSSVEPTSALVLAMLRLLLRGLRLGVVSGSSCKLYIRDIREPWRTLESQFKSVEDKLKKLTADLIDKTAYIFALLNSCIPSWLESNQWLKLERERNYVRYFKTCPQWQFHKTFELCFLLTTCENVCSYISGMCFPSFS